MEWIEDSVRGRLSESASARLIAHLATCAECRAAREDALAMRRSLHGVPTPRCPDHLVARILAATSPARPPAERAPGTLERLAGWVAGAFWRPVALTAAAVLASP
jgi:anti-sigma factor RsiW